VAASRLANAFLPNRVLDRTTALILTAGWAALVLLLRVLSPFATFPTPREVFAALGELWWRQGMGPELFATLKLISHALLLTVVISMALSYLTVVGAFRPLVAAASKLRFLGLTGLVFPFTLLIGGGYALKVALLTFGRATFFVTSMAAVVIEIPRQEFDHLRVLGASEARILYEVVIRGTLDRALEALRQNLAIGWTMITMVEGISRAEGGVGAMILNQNKHFELAEVYAILLVIHLEERARYYPALLSGGERQRVAIAQQILKPKRLLLLDEPFSGLDPAALEDVVRLIVQVANLDDLNTVLIVTHDIRAAILASDTLLVLGRARDANGRATSGARIAESYDLVARGLAWHEAVEELPAFAPLEHEIRRSFRSL
jgi:NitT/TauT family transport system permease protein